MGSEPSSGFEAGVTMAEEEKLELGKGVAFVGPVQQSELVVGQVEQPAPGRPGELGGTGSVIGARDLVDPPGGVEHGEEPDDSHVRPRLPGQPEAVLHHPRPVGNAVIALPREGIVFEDGVQELGDVERQT